jgi:structural maintenance of chromosome 1
LKEAAGKRSASLAQQLERTKHEQSVDEEELEQSKMKKKELETRMEQLTGQLSQHNQKLERLDQYIKTSTEQLSKYREDHDKLSSEMKRAELRYAEVNEALEEIHHKIRDARVDSHENSRAQRKLELLDNLKRLYPGVHGRLFDLCEPVHRRYTIAVTKIMGRHMDSIVVDNAKTGRDCIQHIKEMVSLPK